MRIADLLATKEPFISLEFFPPKEKNEWSSFFNTVDRLAQLNPLFASVTYGAGGSTQSDTLEIVGRLKQQHGLEAMAHLTCIGGNPQVLSKFLDDLAKAEINNVLALRGDLPKDSPANFSPCGTLLNASDLVRFIRSAHPDMGLAVAGYPEKHPEAENIDLDLNFLKLKLESGGDFIITQLFFDNQSYFDFVRNARSIGIDKPIIPGILPVVSLKVIKRIVSLCGASIPHAYLAELEDADRSGGAAAVQKVGVEFARKQARNLLENGAPGVHIYTLNRSDVVEDLTDGLI